VKSGSRITHVAHGESDVHAFVRKIYWSSTEAWVHDSKQQNLEAKHGSFKVAIHGSTRTTVERSIEWHNHQSDWPIVPVHGCTKKKNIGVGSGGARHFIL
jgi:alpha-ketoglutarate-dependent taurine dioxygenase